jgi:tRNA dimethylallyltransferase
MGPTAAGKTDAAICLHELYAGDIISVDSALVYKGMDIGTAKPDAATLRRAPHALVDICEPWEPYSASQFCADALKLMQASNDAGRMPILAGGTMLYYNALQNGLSQLPEADPEVRQQIQQLADERGWEHVHQKLAEVDASHSWESVKKTFDQKAFKISEITETNENCACAAAFPELRNGKEKFEGL